MGDATLFGNSCIDDRKSDASSNGTEKARAVSCEIGDRGFQVEGIDCTEPLSGIKTSFARGAVRGNVLERESGNTSVTTTV